MIYEVMTVLPSHYSDEEMTGVADRVRGMVEQTGAAVREVRNLGKLKLASAIARHRYGTYLLLFVEAAPELVLKIDQQLRLSEDVIRHLVIARPEGIPTADFRMIAYQQPLSPEGRRAQERDERPAARPAVEAAVAAMSPEEITEKIDAMVGDIATAPSVE